MLEKIAKIQSYIMGKLMVLRVAGDNRSFPYYPQVEPLL